MEAAEFRWAFRFEHVPLQLARQRQLRGDQSSRRIYGYIVFECPEESVIAVTLPRVSACLVASTNQWGE
jgi:hypothetical protein